MVLKTTSEIVIINDVEVFNGFMGVVAELVIPQMRHRSMTTNEYPKILYVRYVFDDIFANQSEILNKPARSIKFVNNGLTIGIHCLPMYQASGLVREQLLSSQDDVISKTLFYQFDETRFEILKQAIELCFKGVIHVPIEMDYALRALLTRMKVKYTGKMLNSYFKK